LLKGVKIRLEPTNVQQTEFRKHCGIARATYNWALHECQESYKNTKKIIPRNVLKKRLTAEVKVEKPYYYEVSSKTPQQEITNIKLAYENFYRIQKPSGFKKMIPVKKYGVVIGQRLDGLPQFKKKYDDCGFYLENYDAKNIGIKIIGNKIKLPKIGWVKMSETYLPPHSIKAIVVSRHASDWFVSFNVEHSPKHTVKTKGVVGVDLGIKTLATLSDGTIFPSIYPFKQYQRKLKLLQRKASKKLVKGANQQSNNYSKAQKKVAKCYKKIGDLRKDYTHKITSYLAKNHEEVVIENLNVKGMSSNHKLANAILDGGFFEFKRQLGYKCEWYGSKLTIVSRWYPSSKTCSCCGNKKDKLPMSVRVYKCDVCNMKMDRDLNASINLKNMAVSFTVSACGETYQMSDITKDSFNETRNKQQLLKIV
jgi:putative transposase